MNFKQRAEETLAHLQGSQGKSIDIDIIETALRSVRNETIDEVMELYASDREVSFLQALSQLKERV